MPDKQRTYIAIDLKSFYASVECVERGLDPLTTNLVVADESRTEKTICLAVSPSLKAYGISGRARLFEAVQRVKEVNYERLRRVPGNHFTGKSTNDTEIKQHPNWELDFIRAIPRMAFYIDYSTRIYKIYLKYIAPEDIHVYSIDEVFMDVTNYLSTYKMSAHDLAIKMIRDVLKNTGITATAGIGTNMYLAKIAMDIVAKHIPADKDGVRIAELDEMAYRRQLWDHKPLTSFWRLGRGIADKLALYGIDTMGKLARTSIENEELLYKLFGVNAELLIDHAWGWEPCTMDYIKAYKPETNSMSSGQVLSEPYTFAKARNVVMEMADAISLDLVSKRLVTDQLTLTVNYESFEANNNRPDYPGVTVRDYYGRLAPKPTHGTATLNEHTSSSKEIIDSILNIYDNMVDKKLMVRRLTIVANRIIPEETAQKRKCIPTQLDLFTDYNVKAEEEENREAQRDKERRIQEALINIKQRFGKNAILKGTSFSDGATARDRNAQIGGHKA
ncbi:MAG: DNA methylase [Bacteroidales bacterium]|nr:DNA methylase [Bacteroidales bacterium]